MGLAACFRKSGSLLSLKEWKDKTGFIETERIKKQK
jgi:hypothetical protein